MFYSRREKLIIAIHVIYIILAFVIWYLMYTKYVPKADRKVTFFMIYPIVLLIYVLATYLVFLKAKKTNDTKKQKRIKKKVRIMVIVAFFLSIPVLGILFNGHVPPF